MCEELPIYESSSQKTTFFLTANENILLTGPVSHRSPSFLPAFFDSFSGSTCSGMGYTSFGCPLHNSVESILSFCLHFFGNESSEWSKYRFGLIRQFIKPSSVWQSICVSSSNCPALHPVLQVALHYCGSFISKLSRRIHPLLLASGFQSLTN